MSLFALVDCNNFYVSCERAFAPKLQCKPVVVLSNNDGCAVARSDEVKALGVKMGTPWFQIKDLAKQHGIVALSSNYCLYGDMSNRVMTILRDFSPIVEVYSIDESFLSLDGLGGLWQSPSQLGQEIRGRILQWTGLPVCVGTASSKTLAKLANHVAKKRPEYNGMCDFSSMSETELRALLSSIEVNEVWGCGRRISDRLQTLGITTVQALRSAPAKWIRAHFGVVLERTVTELRGIPCLELEEVPAAKQQIICSKSFGEMVLTIDELAESVSSYATRATEKLRRQNSACAAIHVFIETNRFRQSDRQYANGITMSLAEPTDDTRALVAAALAGLKRIYRPGFWYKKAGVMLMEIGPKSIRQFSLFDDPPRPDWPGKLMKTLDALNQSFGRDTVFLASSGIRHRWEARFEARTPRYTTRWTELPKVRAA